MNTVHLSLFPPHENAQAHAHALTMTQSLTKKKGGGSTREHAGCFRGYEEVECDSAVEGSEVEGLAEAGVYSSSVRKPFCMSSSS